MRSLLRGLIHKICSAVASRTAPTSTALVPVHVSNGSWQQVRAAGSDIVRLYRYTCKCLQWQELTPAEAKYQRERKCGGCGLRYNLLRDLALATDSTIAEYEYALATLPVHALAVQQQQGPKFVPVGDEPVRVEWSGPRDDRRTAAFERGDPEMMGPGFTFPKR